MAHVDSPRRWRMASVIRGGSLEVTAAVLLLAGTVAGSFEVPLGPPALVLSVALCVLVALSGRWPVPVGLAIGAVCTFLVAGLPGQDTLAVYACLAPLVSCGAAGLTRARGWFTVWFGLLLFGQIVTRIPPDVEAGVLAAVLASHAVFVLVMLALAWAAGGAFHLVLSQQRQHGADTLRSLRREIARDLHDGVAYTMSVIAIRAEQGRRQGGASAEDLEFIAEKSREAIADLRNVLAVLRRDQPDGDQSRMDWTVRPLAEVIDTEVRALTDAGFAVAVTVEGDLAGLPRSVADAIGRVLHEAATNVRRHSGKGECVLLVSVTPARVELALANPMPASSHSAHEPLGVIGMRERIEGLGGTLEAGRLGSRWILRSAVPVPVTPGRVWP